MKGQGQNKKDTVQETLLSEGRKLYFILGERENNCAMQMQDCEQSEFLWLHNLNMVL